VPLDVHERPASWSHWRLHGYGIDWMYRPIGSTAHAIRDGRRHRLRWSPANLLMDLGPAALATRGHLRRCPISSPVLAGPAWVAVTSATGRAGPLWRGQPTAVEHPEPVGG